VYTTELRATSRVPAINSEGVNLAITCSERAAKARDHSS
jgi:hypothetical protein